MFVADGSDALPMQRAAMQIVRRLRSVGVLPNEHSVAQVVVSQRTQQILAFESDGSLILHRGGQPPLRLRMPRHAVATCAAFNVPDTHVVVGCKDGGLHVWECASGTDVAKFTAPGGAVSSVDIDSMARHVMTRADDRVCLWSIGTGSLLGTLPAHPRAPDLHVWSASLRVPMLRSLVEPIAEISVAAARSATAGRTQRVVLSLTEGSW